MSERRPDPYQRRPVDIDAYAPPRRTSGTVWLALAAVAGVAAVLLTLWWRPTAPASPPPEPTTTASGTTLPGLPFVMPNSDEDRGRWEVLDHEWSDGAVVVRVRIFADAGVVSYGFLAFSNAGTEVYEPLHGAPDPEIGSGSLQRGQNVEGWLRIEMPRGPATLILTTAGGQQISALPIPG